MKGGTSQEGIPYDLQTYDKHNTVEPNLKTQQSMNIYQMLSINQQQSCGNIYNYDADGSG